MAAKRRKIVAEDFDLGYGATTIPTDSGGVRAASKAGIHTFTGMVDLKKGFGAKGDGSTNDTAAIQSWLNRIYADGLIGIVPPGIYMCDQISLTMAAQRGIKIIGTGSVDGTASPKCIFKLRSALSALTTPMWDIGGSGLIESVANIDGVAFDGDSKTGTGLKFTNIQRRILLRDVAVKRFLGDGVWTYNCTGLNFESLECSSNGVWGINIDGTSSHGEGCIRASTLQVNGTSSSGGQLRLGTGTTNINIGDGTKFYGSGSSGHRGIFFVDEVYGVSIRTCTFEGIGVDCPVMWHDAGSDLIASEIVANNWEPQATTGTKYGIDFPGTLESCKIENNFISGAVSVGATLVQVRVGTVTATTIGNNHFTKTGSGTIQEYSPVDAQRTFANWNYAVVSRASVPVQYIDGAHVLCHTPDGFSLADTGVHATLFDADTVGYLRVIVYNFGAATFLLSGSSVTVIDENPAAGFSTTAGVAGDINVYWDAGDGRYEIQNLAGASVSLLLDFTGFHG